MEIDIEIEFTEAILAGSPSDPKVYSNFLASQTTPENRDEEVAALPVAETGFSVFARTPEGFPHLWDYHIRGFLKEAAAAITGKQLSAYKSKIDRWIFVSERRLLFFRNNEVIRSEDGVMERIVRAMTMQGPRTTPKKSQTINPGAALRFHLRVLPLGEKELTPVLIRSWLDYGQFAGLGEWRSGSNGRFRVLKFEVLEGGEAAA